MESEAKKNSYSPAALVQFAKDSKDELGKVAKPTREETTKATMVTVVIIIFVSVVLALYDQIIGGITGMFLSR